MPLTRYRIKDEYGLADPEIYRSADKDDPEALLEGVAMAGLVGLLRQLGDLAEFAAEIFHDLHEEVMATAARGHGLTVRIQQLEVEFPPIEKALLLQTNHSLYYSNAGTDWHPNLHTRQNLIAREDLPRFVMDSYEESRGPPRLFLLDKFDVGGAGACLKRYTDPSFLKMDTASSGLSTTEVQREKKTRKGKKKGSRWRNGETPECVPSHGKLHQLFMEERIENAYSDPTRRVNLKRRQLNRSPFESKSEKSLMEKFVETPSPESKTIREVPLSLPSLEWRSDDTHGQGLGEVEISMYSPGKISPQENGSAASSLYKQGFESNRFLDCDENHASVVDGEEEETASAVVEKVVRTSGADNKGSRADGYNSEERTSEVDNYLDALATMESDVETDSNWRPMHLQNAAKGGADLEANEEELELQTEFSASQSVGNSGSEDEGSSYGRSSSSFSNQYGGDRFSNVSLPTKITATESVTSSDNQFLYNKEVQDRESEELQVSNCTGTKDKELPNFVEASCISCPTDSDMAAPLEAEPVLLGGSENDEASFNMVKHGLEIPYFETGANAVDSAATQIQDDSVSTNSVECLTMDAGAKEEVCSKEVEHPIDLELPSKTENNDFPVDEMLNMKTVPEETAENLLVSSEARSSTKEKDQFSQIAADVESASVAGSEVSDTAVRLDNPTLQANESQLDKSGTERNISNVEVECYEGNTEENSRKLDDENIDSLNLNVDGEGVASISGSDGHANSSDFVVAGDNFGDSAASGHEQFLGKSERESLSDVDNHDDEGNCEETVLEGERIGSSTYDVELGGGETALGFPPEVSVSENLIISDCSVSDEVYGRVVANSGAAPSTEDKVNYLDHDDAGCGDSSSVDLEDSDSDIRVPSEKRLDRKEQGIIDEENELQVGPTCSDSKHSDSSCAADKESMLPDHANTAEDKSESSLAEGILSQDFYDDKRDVVPTPPVNSLLASESKNLLGELETKAVEDQETNEAIGSENLSELADGGLQDELSEANDATKLSGHQFDESESSISSNQDNCEDFSSEVKLTAPPANTDDPPLGLISEEAGLDAEDTPPLPPIPPMQWIGKLQNASVSSETDLPGFSFGLLPPLQPFADDGKPSYNDGLQTSEEKALPSGDQQSFSFDHEHDQLQHDLYQTGPNPFSLPMPFMNRDMHINSNDLVTEEKQSTSSSLLHDTEATQRSELPSHALGEEVSQSDLCTSNVDPMAEDGIYPKSSSSVQPTAQIHPQKLSEAEDLQDTADNPEEDKSTESSLPTDPMHQPTVSGVKYLRHTPEIAEEGNCSDSCTATSSGQEEQQPHYNLPDYGGHFGTERALQANSESGKPNGTLSSNIPRPPKPLIDAVAAHDRSKLRKVAERVRPNLVPKLEERDSMLEQIRAKSFNLKPAVLTRPSVHQGPKTNLRVAAILEKANAIRQAMGGSHDDDDDGDSWSDSD